MTKIISKITKQQEALIPQYIQKWVDLASQPIDRTKLKDILKKIYGEEKIIVIGESLQNTIDLIKVATEGKKIEYDSQLYSQLYSQLRFQLHSQLYSQLDSQLHSQLYSQLDSQLHSQLDSQLDSQLHSQLHSQLDSQLHSQNFKYSSYISYYLYDWAGYYDYAQKIGVEFDKKSLEQYLDILINIPIIIFVGNVIFVCEKPVCRWEDKKLHSELYPAIGWKDGTGIYFLNGVKFEKEMWEKITQNKLSPQEALKIESTDQRAIALKYIGGERLMKETGGKVIGKDEYGEIIELDLKDGNDRNFRYYKALDPSKKEYVYLRCHPDCASPTEAMNRAYKLQMWNISYKPELRT
ncbi:MAG: hypothetical protein NUV97_02935 [archaeon]|nr:hypothetical protein [archaeon]